MRFLQAEDKADRHRSTRFLLSVGLLKIRHLPHEPHGLSSSTFFILILRTFSKDLKSKLIFARSITLPLLSLFASIDTICGDGVIEQTIYLCENAGNIPNLNERRQKISACRCRF